MTLNKVKEGSNMYSFLNDYPTENANRGFTWNPVAGECQHFCEYCYMKKGRTKNLKKYQGEVRIVEKEMKTNLGSGNYIFVGSATDIFGEWISDEIIKKILDYCKRFDNRYLFQSKNPKRMDNLSLLFPPKTILGTTIESNITYQNSKAPPTWERMEYMTDLSKRFTTMVSLEPIMQFDKDILVAWIRYIQPKFVSIGADSKGCDLMEPLPDKIEELISELKGFTDVKIKSNLERLMK